MTVRKGSVNAILSLCSISDEDRTSVMQQAENLAATGMRVMAVARGAAEGRLQLVGLAGVADRIRPDARGIVAQLNDLRVAVKLLTGDSLPIARNIAHQIGLNGQVIGMPRTPESAAVAQVADLVEESSGIAEVYPEDKFAIVQTLQRRKHIVGMTGDGLNDAPALKQAEVGIAVSNATDVAKDAASAVLATAGLAGTIAMIKMGRTAYQRIFSWVLNMITMKTHLAGYIVVTLFVTHYFVISVIGMVLLVLMTDIATMSLTMDNVRYSKNPDSLDVSWLFKVGVSLGLLGTIEGVLLTLMGGCVVRRWKASVSEFAKPGERR